MNRFLLGITVAVLFAPGLHGSAAAQTPSLREVATPPTLSPLPLSIGGRVLASHSAAAAGFGSEYLADQWPGAYFSAAFKGSEVFFRIGENHEILHIVVDGQPPLLLKAPPAGVYRLAGLANTAHAITVFVATESQAAPNHFDGFGIPAGEEALPTAPRARQIEFIGDSHTVGYGNTSATHTCTPDQIWAKTDDTQAFGPLTAMHFGADYQVNAISGRGVVRNYNGFAADTLPDAYPFVLFNKQQRYEDSHWRPQVLVIALGTNDFSTPLNPGEKWKTREELHADYEATYLRFLQSLRRRDPGSFIIVWATGVAGGEIETEESKVVDRARELGDKRIAFLPINGLEFSGCDSHPSVADDKTISDRLARLIDATPKVWQGK